MGTHYRAMEEALEEKDNTITELKIKLDALQAELARLEEKLQKSESQVRMPFCKKANVVVEG